MLNEIGNALQFKFKRAVTSLLLPRVKTHQETLRCGSDYGGWVILPEYIQPSSVIYSFGVGEDVSFDVELIDRFGVNVFAFDPTPRSLEWVAEQGLHDKFKMHPYGIAAFNGEASFNPPENPKHVSHTILDRPSTSAKAIKVNMRRLSTIMKDLGHTGLDVLKMDIEGAEYDVIDDILASQIPVTQLLIEFHHRFPGVGRLKTRRAIKKLQVAGYMIFSISPTFEEFCFVR